MVERIVDWEKARLLAAKRFGEIITACNQADSEALKALIESGLGTEEDYTSSPENIFKLNEKGCFMYKGFTCQICDCYEWHKSTDEGAAFYTCRVAVYDTIEEEYPKWIIIPYILYSIPSDCYMDKYVGLLSAINEATVNMTPASYDEMVANAMV